MSEPLSSAPAESVPGVTAGRLLREAREARGLSVATLSALVKVAQRKVESLEADRLDELLDATFARALAQTLCRALKVDATPVLSALPDKSGYRLDHLGEGINTPFRDRSNRPLARDIGGPNSPWVWASLAVVVAAAVVYLVPLNWWVALTANRSAVETSGRDVEPTSAATASSPLSESVSAAASTAASTAIQLAEHVDESPRTTAASAPVVVDSAALPTPRAAAVAASTAGPSNLRLYARAESWVEVQDAQGHVLLSRTLGVGEQVALEGAAPLRLKIGNAESTDVAYRGVPVDLAPSTRDNVARLEIKP